MTLEHYWTTIAKQWKLIIICCILAGLGTFIGSKLIPRVYQSTAFVEVHSGGTDYASTLADTQRVQTETTLVTSGPILSQVASHYPGLTVAQLAKEVTAVAKLNTSLFEIDVQDTSPTRASALANDIANTLINQQTEQAKQDNARSQQLLQQDLQQTQQQIVDITSQITALQGTNGRQGEVSALSGQLIVVQTHLNQVQSILVLLRSQNFDTLRLAQPAVPPSSPARPNVPLNTVAGLFIGLFLGILLALALGLLDTRIRTQEALTQLLDWPILATMSRADSQKDEFTNLAGQSANIETYRILLTNVGFSAIDKPLHSLVVTSVLPGKSSIAGNLAIFMARAGKNTILVDADLHHPTLHEKFHLPGNSMGLSNAVLAFSQLSAAGSSQQSSTPLPSDPYLHTVDTPNLRVMPSGPLPPNVPELLHSKAMERLLIAAAADYGAEIVIFDAPPLLGLADTSMLAPKVDGTVVLVDITRANKKNLNQAQALLNQAGARVLGCIVIEQRHSRKDSAYSSRYTEAGHPGIENEAVTSGTTIASR